MRGDAGFHRGPAPLDALDDIQTQASGLAAAKAVAIKAKPEGFPSVRRFAWKASVILRAHDEFA